jgi:hypothetical protein
MPAYHWGTYILGPGPPGWGLDARLTTLLCKKIVTKSKDVKTRFNLAEYSEEGYGSKSYVLPMMITFRRLKLEG